MTDHHRLGTRLQTLAAQQPTALEERIRRVRQRMSRCDLCPRACGVDRNAGELGFCRTGACARVATWHLHQGEEAPLVGSQGSGTIFFASCNLNCVFCQNLPISRDCPSAIEVGPAQLADIMLELQEAGAANINLVTPSHVVGPVLESLPLALDQGLRIPLVYNTGSYDAVSTLELLDGVMDLYLPDTKVWDPDLAATLLGARDYPEAARAALLEMHRQVGPLRTDRNGSARAGLIIRHLVLSGRMSGHAQWIQFIADYLGTDAYLNIMGQYRPCGPARRLPGLDRVLEPEEYLEALAQALLAGFTRLDRLPS